MTASIDLASLRERVRDALDWPLIAKHFNLVIRKAGPEKWTTLCPYHAEKTPSFVLGGSTRAFRDKFKCWGCDARGDFFDFYEDQTSKDHVETVKDLAGLAGVSYGELSFDRPKAAPVRTPEKRLDPEAESRKKPSLPPLFKLNRAACEEIARTRGLDVEAVWLAARVFRRAAYSPWPIYQRRGGDWLPRCQIHGYACRLNEANCEPAPTFKSWVAVDDTRNVAEFRRLDNEKYEKHDGTLIKTWSTAGKSWPLGAADVRGCKRVLLVEGGPDMLAAYHLLRMWRMENQVAVVAMLGASNRIREDALPFFEGCHVRIMVDADLPKDDPVKHKRKLVGVEAAKRWEDQLTGAGAAVIWFNVGDIYVPEDVAKWHAGELPAAEIRVDEPGYVLPDGSKAKDTNDLCRCSDDIVRSDDVRRAMTWWDF